VTELQLRAIWRKTNGHCHFCGDPVSLRKRGYKRQRADGYWEVDHVLQRAKGGPMSFENCLPACTSCNRLRWHRRGPAIRELLVLGLIAKFEIQKLTEIGKQLVRLRAEQVRRTARRRQWTSVAQIKLRDPVLIEQIHHEDRKALIRFLTKHLQRSFTAGELHKHTGVAKNGLDAFLRLVLRFQSSAARVVTLSEAVLQKRELDAVVTPHMRFRKCRILKK
jgi:HNH endonuclease